MGLRVDIFIQTRVKNVGAEGKVTVIPMHSTDIGLGLSHAIQKQILA